MKKTLIYIDNLERYSFYMRLMEALKEDEEFIVLTNKLSVYLKIKNRYKVYLLKNIKSAVASSPNLEDTLSVACKYHTLEQAKYISSCVNGMLESIFSENEVKMIFVFNGTTTIGKTIGDFCKKNSVASKFIEISNLPNKLFVDSEGTNAKSHLYKYPELLDSFLVSDEEFEEWKEEYIQTKSAPKQAKNRTKIRYLMLLDYLGYLFLNILQEDYRSPLKVIKNKFLNRKTQSFPKLDLEQEYIFFPMQVSNDSQLILNSDIDNAEAIKKIKKESPQSKLFIKPHPAEENSAFMHTIEQLQTKNVTIVSNDTNKLILHAKKVVTINSTVGLEAMILGKEVEVLGRALYAGFTRARLKSYICRYLINIDYFDGVISKDEARRLYEK